MKTLFLLALPIQLYCQVFHPSQIQMHWKNKRGEPYVYFDSLLKEHPKAIFAMNAGMFTPEHKPVGLYIERWNELVPKKIVNSGKSNFAIQPQGVFAVDDIKAWIVPVKEFFGRAKYATQSAPMIVINGKINPNLPEGGRIIRNGVGIRKDGKVFFAIKTMTFREFARHFIDNGCTQALYLDGGISEKWEKGEKAYGGFGAFIVAY